MTNRRSVLCFLTVLAFFVSILEPVPEIIWSDVEYTFLSSSSEGTMDKPLDLGSSQKFCRAFYESNQRIDIDFSVIATTLENRYTNIFQTDNVNMGLRLEINSEGELSALVHSPDGGSEKLIGVVANGVIRPNVLTRIHVSVSQDSLEVNIDDGPVALLEGNLMPTCRRVLIGGGFDSSRTTDGEVRAKIHFGQIEFVTTFGLPMRARDTARILLTLLVIALVLEYRQKLFKLNDKRIE
jgi:hypothetical protein